MYLVDTNIWLERLLNQDKSDEVGQFLKQVSASDLSVTDFTFHSICVVLIRLGRRVRKPQRRFCARNLLLKVNRGHRFL
jgi:predicted nucleic acid-binding protein